MSQLINKVVPAYDPDSTGWDPPGSDTIAARRAAAQVRCGWYLDPQTGERMWGDHRVTWPGTTCREVSCYTSHHPHIAPGWAEPVHPDESYDAHTRPGVGPITAVLWGWNHARRLPYRLDQTTAAAAAHLAMDALRDAGYTIIPPAHAAVADGTAQTTSTEDTDDPRQ